ncbi:MULTISPECIES: THUMP domain-containing class I SAM-dependent RNA methyltransferase [unclassified Coleofasciculus]|uniref:THUMP domain-containing class I SAM-dependent RNA methyltransferase n=1 Tax=unclassified Coleofasciculus TaxID=2692782 RepID=UPI001881B964|nr:MULTISPECIES: THUMP domain-containing protein [unclassified Coleofasciculus]MBE9128802.1 RNA methyltransferase [Coleofasciculus sp. LEGE 07081]MBE9151521.1 RNA methyltransferase [Coleofasciculus sp. LEGE 07092]
MNQYFATVARGLEAIAAKELERLGALEVRPDFTGVHFQGDRTLMYRVNLWARTIFRVLVILAEFPCSDANSLYQGVQSISWERYLQPHQTFAVNATGGNRQLNHTHFTALQVKNAIADQQRRQFGQRSSVDTKNPDILVNSHIHQNRCILSLDSSGASLHRRGYRPAVGLAPLKETLAAALLELAEYSPTLPFLDPLCGSGTLPLEASLKALNIAPGLFRQRFGFESWLDFDKNLWEELLQEAETSKLQNLSAPIIGSDRNGDILNQARMNAERCGVIDQVTFIQKELSQLEPPADRGVIICNPPYGERLGNVRELGEFYKLLGDVFKQRFKGWTAFILTGNKELAKRVGLKASRRIPLYNGSLPCTFLLYELY